MIWGNELLMDLAGEEGANVEWGILCLSQHKCIILLVSHGGGVHCPEHGLCFTYPSVADLLGSLLTSGLTTVERGFEFIPSPATIFSKNNNFQSFTLMKMGHVYHICLAMSKQTILTNAPVCNVLTKNVDHPTAIQDYTATSWDYQ